MKTCTKCRVEKELGEFYKSKSKKDGLQSQCKGCDREKSRQWHEANPEKHRETSRKWAQANPEKEAERIRKWREANSEKEAERSRKWAQANPEKNREKSRRWHEANPEKHRERKQRRRHLKAAAPHDPTCTREALRERQGDQCAYCGVILNFDTSDYKIRYDPTHVNIEHWVPLSKGGGQTFDNCFLICRRCNSSRNNVDFIEWYGLTDEEVDFCKELTQMNIFKTEEDE